ncbi:MAG: ABC transporter permease [Hyphomicrobiales bacterium]|nr:ABC transporter permease [Hyphomicrobiales bacterium]
MSVDKLRGYLPLLTLVAAVALVGALDSSFLRPASLLQVAADVSALFVMALGITFAIYIGGIDLSAQSVASMTTVIVSATLPSMGASAVPLVLAIGALFGVASGVISVRAKIPTFITTLALGGVAYSIGQYVSGEKSLSIPADQRESLLGWMYGNVGPMPKEILVACALLIGALIVERRTVVGRIFKAVGAGELGAIASGIRVERYKIAAFAISGTLAAMAGLMLAARLSGGSPTAANQFLLPAIVAVLVGGTPLTGGVGGVLNTAVGALIVAVVRTSMVYLEVPAQGQQIFFGLVLIAAIALTIDRRKVRTVK